MSKYKQGDKVRVIANQYIHNKQIGDIIEVKEAKINASFIYENGWYMYDSDVELITEKITNNFEIGDKVRYIKHDGKLAQIGDNLSKYEYSILPDILIQHGSTTLTDDQGEVINTSYGNIIVIKWKTKSAGGFLQLGWKKKDLKLIKTNKTNNMNILEQIKLARKSEPEKTLVKAKLMNMDESLTPEGQQVLNDLLVQEYKTKMKTVADLILAKEEKK